MFFSGIPPSAFRLLRRKSESTEVSTLGVLTILVPFASVENLNRPAPISEADVQKIVDQMKDGTEKPRHKVEFIVGEYIRVKEGPFTDFNGTVEDVNYDKNKLRVSVTIFGRSTPVELEFSQVEKG